MMLKNQYKNVVLGNKVKGLLAEHNQSYKDLAQILSIHENTLSLKINNRRSFTAEELKTIADHYKVDINIFFS